MKRIWRWLLVLPAAIGAYIAAILVQNIILLLAGANSGDFGLPWLLNNFREVTDIIFRAVGIYFYVIAGASVAPRIKYPTALALSSLVWIFSIFVLALVLLFHIQTQIVDLIEVPFLCGAAVIACVQKYRKEKQIKEAAKEPELDMQITTTEVAKTEVTTEPATQTDKLASSRARVRAAWEAMNEEKHTD